MSKFRLYKLFFLCFSVLFSGSLNAENYVSDSITNIVVLETILRNMMIDAIEEEHGSIEMHIVDRGESWTLLAANAGLEEWELMALNPESSDLITGMEIRLPIFQKWSQRYENKIIAVSPEFSEAEEFMKKGEWGKAKKVYDKILKKNDSLTAFYLRGIANYNKEKFKEAVSDFGMVEKNDCFSLFDDASTLRSQASEAWEQKKQARAEFWGNLAETVLRVGAEAMNTYYQTKQMQYAARNNGSYSSIGSSPTGVSIYSPEYAYSGSFAQQLSQPGYIQQQFQMLANMSIYQVQQQEQEEYQQMRQWYLAMGKDISLDEYRAIKGQAIAEMNSNNVNNESTSMSSNVNSVNTTNPRKCVYCNGTGRIVKEQSVPTFGLDDPKVKCEEWGGYFPRSWAHHHYDCIHCNHGIAK